MDETNVAENESNRSPWSLKLSSSISTPLAPCVQCCQFDGILLQEPVSAMDFRTQEKVLISDVLNALMGMQGTYVRLQNAQRNMDGSVSDQKVFKLVPGFHPSLADIASEIVLMGNHLIAIQAFVNEYSAFEYGRVNNALCAAIRNLCREYLLLVTQCERQSSVDTGFSLQTLRLYTLPTAQSLSHLYSLTCDLILETKLAQKRNTELDLSNIDNILERLNEGNGITDVFNNPPGKRSICKGGRVLRFLSQRIEQYAGDPGIRELLTFIFHESSKPYTEMLNYWIHRGVIEDPYEEFMIKAHRGITAINIDDDYTDELWEKRYTIQDELVPLQLEPLKDKVLLAGKYLNVVRECYSSMDKPWNADNISESLWPTTFDNDVFMDAFLKAYGYANESLLQVLKSTQSLYAHLYSLKHYFFLDKSDFFTSFLDIAGHELRKNASQISVSRLQSQLELSLRQPGTLTLLDPNKEYVGVEINQTSLLDWLLQIVSINGLEETNLAREPVLWLEDNSIQHAEVGDIDKSGSRRDGSRPPASKEIDGFHAMQLTYRVPFPLSLILSRKATIRYQLLFRFLLMLRHNEMQLESTWIHFTKQAIWNQISSSRRVEVWKKHIFQLRVRMLFLVRQLTYYCTAEVIEPNWTKFMEGLEKARTVDVLMQKHVDFLDTCLKECMLTNSKMLKVLSKLLTTCTMFASYTSTFTRSLTLIQKGIADTGSLDEARMAKMEDVLRCYDENYSHNLKVFLDACSYFASIETAALLSLVMRLTT
ncbi:gamma tubulin complex Spc97/GCP2 subunit Alp4 [Schizosaccharomyces japonicus yFS275]|uniref:Spindle pole body component n=1 Tax=Schizosaccharomyces japonicus (strain yFS275 / FY16936) TaxID=402676 RepID=B6K566_SCHJY|nr:gamma tubulin complex Spc97/GCP2 subunit Alp4 [Schizosaccharomyces japonicus yFS275]EEB08670.1 gamma tubulin complex Spc97/GCP2 subunit Alp4 [Schizosaccharomyces japonicus yFS275]